MTAHVYDNYEISGCVRRLDNKGEPYIEVAGEGETPEFWTLYGHIEGEGAEAIGDFTTREAAEEVFRRITGEPFCGSYQAAPRLRLMHAAPQLRAALRAILPYAENEARSLEALKDSPAAEAEAEAAWSAIAQAQAALDATEAGTGGGAAQPYSVLLLYPDYAGDYGTDTYYAFVHATDPLAAAQIAQRQASAAQAGAEIAPGDFTPLLVVQGHHASEPLFNQ